MDAGGRAVQEAIAEGWGEGLLLRKCFNGASFTRRFRRHRPLTSILSPKGRGGERKKRVTKLKRERVS